MQREYYQVLTLHFKYIHNMKTFLTNILIFFFCLVTQKSIYAQATYLGCLTILVE